MRLVLQNELLVVNVESGIDAVANRKDSCILILLFFFFCFWILFLFFYDKFDKDEMTSDNRASLLKRRDEMLLLSESCFTSALGIEDGEPWLHHYILGKITEKLNKPPSVYLEHYQKARNF